MNEKFTINIEPEVEEDLREIWHYIAKDNPFRAGRFVRALEQKVKALDVFPERCPRINYPHLDEEYRQLIYENYRIIFQIIENQVNILRIVHSARLLESMLLTA